MIKLLITALLSVFCYNAFAQEVQLLQNPNFESNKVGWSSTGGAFTIDTATPLTGKVSVTWDPSTTGQFVNSSLYTVPSGIFGKTCMVSMRYLWPSGVQGDILLKVHDGTNDLASYILTPTAAAVTQVATMAFDCPSSGSIRLRLESTADAAVIKFDEMFLGQGRNSFQVSQPHLVFSGYFAGTAGCSWTRANTALGAMTAVAACPGITTSELASGYTIDSSDDDLPQLKFTNLPPGKYKISVDISPSNSTAGTNATCALYDGTNLSNDRAYTRNSDGAPSVPATIRHIYTQTATSNVTFAVHCASSSGTMALHNGTTNTLDNTSFIVERIPLNPQEALSVEAVGFKIDANIAGANIDLGTADQAAYITPNNASLTLTANPGSYPVGISCSSTNDNTVGATTCSAGSEEPGIVINIPKAGTIQYCFDFAHNPSTSTGGSVITTFQVVQTPNGSQTIQQEGKSRVQSGHTNANDIQYHPLRVCGNITHTSSGKKTIRLMYEQDNTGTIASNVIPADAAANFGQRDIHITAYYIDQNLPALVISDVANKVNAGTSGVTTRVAELNCDSSSSITRQLTTWISSIGNVVAGACVVTLTSGIFSNTPFCQIASTNVTNPDQAITIAATSATSVTMDCDSFAGTDCVLYNVYVECTGN